MPAPKKHNRSTPADKDAAVTLVRKALNFASMERCVVPSRVNAYTTDWRPYVPKPLPCGVQERIDEYRKIKSLMP